MRRRRILFAVHDWGLGHATRDLALIRALDRNGYDVAVLSAGRALMLLQQELRDNCSYFEFRDIPKPLSRRALFFYIKMSLALPLVFLTFRRERRFVEHLWREEHFDCIVSDSRYGVCLPRIPSYYLVHSLRQIIPGRPRRLERFVERAQQRMLGGARKILIPDQRDNGLAGELCHQVHASWGEKLEYIGILSSIEREEIVADIDCFISISGAEPQRTIFEEIIFRQVESLPGRIVVALGRPDLDAGMRRKGRVSVFNHLNRRRQQEMMNRARLIVSRSGYTTLMELAEVGKRALLIPTVGQSEQEYLASYHDALHHARGISQSRLNLVEDIAAAEKYAGLPVLQPTRRSIERFLDVIDG